MAVTYRLKDRELQKKLDNLTDGNFSGLLAETMSEDNGLSPHISVDCGEWINPHANEQLAIYRFRVYFRKDEIEAVHVYDPKAWNEYPDVEPPPGVWMRLEAEFGGKKYGYKAKFFCGSWRDDYIVLSVKKGQKQKIRFRPWDDESES